MIPLVVHQPAQQLHNFSGSAHKSSGDNVVRMWVQLKRWCVSCVWMLQRGYSGDGCVLVSTLFKYDLKKGDLFVLSWARVRNILLLPLVARCLETIDVCIMAQVCFYVCCSDCVGVCGNICCLAFVFENRVFLVLEC